MQTHLTAVKKEELGERITPVRPCIAKGKGQELVRLAAHEEASDTHVDGFTEDSESLFGISGLITATTSLLILTYHAVRN